MDKIQERISYIEGLAEGLDLYQNKKEGKVISEVLSILSELNETVQHTVHRLSELEEYVEAVDEDLNDMEWDYYEEDEPLDVEEDVMENQGVDDVIEDDIGYYRVVCPACHETVMIDDDLLQEEVGEVVCPNCHEVLIVDNEEHFNAEQLLKQ